jgi:hypothetical protein
MEKKMILPSFVARSGNAVLWSWEDYHYSIDIGDMADAITMYNTSFEEAYACLLNVGGLS